MIRLVASLALLLLACSTKEPVKEAPPSPSASPPDAHTPTPCEEYQAVLRAVAGRDVRTRGVDEAYCGPGSRPEAAGWRPIGKDDRELERALRLPGAVAPDAPAAHVYVEADGQVPLAELRALRERLPAATELRLVVGKPWAELVAAHAAEFPRTPKALVDELGALPADRRGLDVLLPATLKRAEGCPAAQAAFQMTLRGDGLDKLGPALAEALAGCRCQMADVDGLVSSTLFTFLPARSCGYLPVEPAVLAKLPRKATVGDLVAAAGKK